MALCHKITLSTHSISVTDILLIVLGQKHRRVYFARKRSDYLDKTSTSDDSSIIIDTDDEQNKNSGSNNVQEH